MEHPPRLEEAVLRGGEALRCAGGGRRALLVIEERELPAGPRARNGRRRRARGERFALGVEEEGIGPEDAGITALDQPRDGHHAEGKAGHGVERTDVDASARQGPEGQPFPLEASLEDGLHFPPGRPRAHRGEAREIGQHLRDRVAVALAPHPRVEDRLEPP